MIRLYVSNYVLNRLTKIKNLTPEHCQSSQVSEKLTGSETRLHGAIIISGGNLRCECSNTKIAISVIN